MGPYVRLAACSLAFGAMLATASQAQQTIIESVEVEVDAQLRVNLAGRQRMLSQRMSKAVCLLNRGIEPKMQLDSLKAARNDFAVVLSALGSKNEEIGLVNEEKNSRVLRGIADVEDIWNRFDGALGTMLESGEFPETEANIVYTESDPLLGEMNKLVSTIEQMHADPSVMMAAQGIVINVAGRQRMLTQKMGKELCQIFAGWGDTETRAKLQQTMNMFEVSHKALVEGNAAVGIVAPPTEEIKDALEGVSTQWNGLRAIIQSAIDGGSLSAEDIAKYAKEGDELLRDINAIVGLYEKT